MGEKNTLRVFGGARPYTLVVEPWADEFLIAPDDHCEVVAINAEYVPFFEVGISNEKLVVWVNEGGTTYEFWRNHVRES